MASKSARPARRVRLEFRSADELPHADEPIRSDLSALALSGGTLWVTNDELATVERLMRTDARYGRHQPFHLGDFFELPGGSGDEMDIEGLEIDGGYLWVLGSHSLTREKPKPGSEDHVEALRRLTEVEHHPNRHFLEVPGKENGFDLEGIAVRGSRVFLGLRGPVLRGWAMLLQLDLKEPRPGRLKPRRIGPGGERYRKHFLDLDGLGIRDLCFDQDRLLILAGPTMDLDGPIRVLSWPGCLEAGQQGVVPANELEAVLEVPYRRGADHAEGIAILRRTKDRLELMVVYDSPAKDRLHDNGRGIDADIFVL